MGVAGDNEAHQEPGIGQLLFDSVTLRVYRKKTA